jgi:tetratricopeptide (TPR) repeat protein
LHPSTARIYNNIGCVHVEFNEHREARRAFEAALDVQRSALSHNPHSGPLLFATATTLSNLGYLYRFRDMHSKAASVLREAVELQERVLGRTHSTVLSTLDNLADSCANSGQTGDALKYYSMVLERFKAVTRSGGGSGGSGSGNNNSSENVPRAEAVLLYKMSRVHRQRNDREAQLSALKLALRAVRAQPLPPPPPAPTSPQAFHGGRHDRDDDQHRQVDTLERRIQYDIRTCREQLEKEELEWV